jgi:hypothetical protein
MLERIANYAQSLASPQLVLPDSKRFVVDSKRIEATMATMSGNPIRKTDPAVILSISPIRAPTLRLFLNSAT